MSFHGEKSWNLDSSGPFHTFGFMYAETTQDHGVQEDSFIYCACNTHWEEHTLELPVIPDGMKWHIVLYTADDEMKQCGKILQDRVTLMPRSCAILLGKKSGGA